MKPLDIILVDDEKECIRVLEYQLKRLFPEFRIVEKCNSAKCTLLSINRSPPDLILLDINMPHISGLELIEMLPKGDFDIIFTTAYEHYALKAFKSSAVDYLLKPIADSELKEAVLRTLNRKNNLLRSKLEFLTNQIKAIQANTVKKIMLPTIDGLRFISLREIIYCESAENYAHIYLIDGSKVFITKPLKFLEEILEDYQFGRIHKSYIINYDQIKKYNKTDGGHVVMENGKSINISRSKKNIFNEFLEEYC